MKKLIAAVVRQPVTIIMIVALLIFGGVAGTLNMPLQLIPDIKIPIISVIVTYPGASAETVEEDVTSVLETDLSGVSGSTSVMSGRPLPVSHFETALSVTPISPASSRWVQPFFSRSARMAPPVT